MHLFSSFVIIFVLICPIFSYATELKNPCKFNCSQNKDSPWKYYLNFENDLWRKVLKPNNIPSSGGMGFKPFKIIKENQNNILSITVKHKYNSSTGGSNRQPTERAELETFSKNTFGKEIWYGFKVKGNKNFKILPDRLLISQMKHRLGKYIKKPQPFVAIKNAYIETENLEIGVSLCKKHLMKFNYTKYNQTHYSPTPYCRTKKIALDGKFEINNKEIRLLSKDEWTTYVVGTFITHKSNGFLKVFQNQEQIISWKGPTYGWSKLVKTNIRIGLYRDGHPNKNKEYPPQTLYFDDFVIGSKDEVTKILWK